MARWVRVLAALMVLLPGAFRLPAAAAEPGDVDVPLRLLTRRVSSGVMIRGCLPDVPNSGTTDERRAHVVVRIDGTIVADVATVAGEYGPLRDDADCPEGALVRHMLGTDVLEQAGVTPRQGTWTTFGLTMEVDIAGLAAHFSSTQRFSISEGAPSGAVTGSEWTANGALVRGWAANPSFGPSTRLVVTVDGTDWSPMNLAPASGVHWFVADKRTSDPLWVERGFADGLGFEFLAPAGTTCVAAMDERPGVHPAVPLGCIRSTSDGRPTAVFTQIQQLSAPGQFARPVRLSGYVTDPWAGPGERPALTLVADYGTYYQIHYAEGEPARDRMGPISDGSGVFRFDVTMSDVAPGNVRFCVAVGRGNEPTWWLNLHLPPPGERRDLGCTVRYINAQLPTPPKGALDEMTASGGAVSARGWVLDPNGGSPRVMLAVDGRPVAIDRTRLPRPDVRQVVGGDGNSGYQLTSGTTTGSHEVCVLWEDTTTGQWSSPTCRQLVVK